MKAYQLLVALLLLLLLSGCADRVDFVQAAGMNPVGFWYGLWHGMILPISFIVSIFDADVTVYAIYNNGTSYNVGFCIGLMLLGGSSSSSSK